MARKSRVMNRKPMKRTKGGEVPAPSVPTPAQGVLPPKPAPAAFDFIRL